MRVFACQVHVNTGREGSAIEVEKVAVRRILDKLGEVRSRGLTSFGSELHCFQLNPPVDEGTLQRFEQEHDIRLPEGYRAFLLLAGNGGAGPYYGLLPVEKWDDALPDPEPGILARPSPLRPGMPKDVPWEQSLGCSEDDLWHGMLALVHQGCSYYALLVVTGPHRGRVVYIDQDLGGSPYFVPDPDFLSWYERWLDELLWGFDGSWFGAGLPGREPDLVRVLTEGGEPGLQAEALTTLGRITALQPETLRALRPLLRGGSADVREQACRLLGKHQVSEAAAEINGLLEDPEPGVRKAALDALTRLPGEAGKAAARRLLGDVNESVVFRALCVLKDAGVLSRDDVEPLFNSPDRIVRRNALWASAAIQNERVDVPVRVLCDPDEQVRREAILAWGRVHPDRAAALIGLLRNETDLDLISCLIGTLGQTGDRSAVPVLIEMTRHADAFVRQDAARALGKLGDPRAIPALTDLLGDGTVPYRQSGSGSTTSAFTVAGVARTALRQLEKG